MKRQILTIFAISCSVFWGCKPNMDKYQVKPSSGSGTAQSGGPADFSRYVALGNSLTSGYSDGALYDEGQRNSYPALIAQQFQTVGGGGFTIPYIGSEDGFGGNPLGSADPTHPFVTKLRLQPVSDCKGVVSLSPKAAYNNDYANGFAPKPGPYNNMGVPGAKANHLSLKGYAAYNPFYKRIATSGSSSILADAMTLNPTFFSLWIGNNDVLGFATTGGQGDVITPLGNFQAGIRECLDSLTKHGAKGIIGNIPDVTAIPFCTTVPYNGLVLTRQGQVDSLNAFYAGYFPTSGIVFKLGQNPFVGDDGSGRRFLKSTEYVLLTVPQDSLKCYNLGSLIPLRDRYFLDATEVQQIKDATTGYNDFIATEAATRKIALVDMNANLVKLAKGITFDGVLVNSVFVQGGAFSLDGVHLTPRGAAAVANYYIDAINSFYGSSIPTVNVAQYRGVVFP